MGIINYLGSYVFILIIIISTREIVSWSLSRDKLPIITGTGASSFVSFVYNVSVPIA